VVEELLLVAGLKHNQAVLLVQVELVRLVQQHPLTVEIQDMLVFLLKVEKLVVRPLQPQFQLMVQELVAQESQLQQEQLQELLDHL
jgi:hypothetical protein